jgi:DNA-binding XRE family transcriptional regulator
MSLKAVNDFLDVVLGVCIIICFIAYAGINLMALFKTWTWVSIGTTTKGYLITNAIFNLGCAGYLIIASFRKKGRLMPIRDLDKKLTIADAIRCHRKCEEWTQEEVAYVLGITVEEYNCYENGYALPTVELIRKMAKLFGASEKMFLSYANGGANQWQHGVS